MRGTSFVAVGAAILIVEGAGLAVAKPLERLPSLPTLPSLPLVRIEAARDHLTVVEEVNLPRGDWQSGDLDLYVAFAAPGVPRAIDAHLFAVGQTALETKSVDGGEPIAVEVASRRPTNTFALLGRPQMAGVVVHLREAAFRRALAVGGIARVRLRALHDLPPQDAHGGREVVIRLGSPGGAPLALDRIELRSLERAPWIVWAAARLCGPDADSYPLGVSLVPPPVVPSPPASPRPTAPSLAVRHLSDDLCVRFGTT